MPLSKGSIVLLTGKLWNVIVHTSILCSLIPRPSLHSLRAYFTHDLIMKAEGEPGTSLHVSDD